MMVPSAAMFKKNKDVYRDCLHDWFTYRGPVTTVLEKACPYIVAQRTLGSGLVVTMLPGYVDKYFDVITCVLSVYAEYAREPIMLKAGNDVYSFSTRKERYHGA